MTTESSTLAEVLSQESVKGEPYEKLPDNRVRCISCGHRCLIPEGRLGICKVRFNQEGVLMVPWGYVGANKTSTWGMLASSRRSGCHLVPAGRPRHDARSLTPSSGGPRMTPVRIR